MEVDSNTTPYSKLEGTTLNGREEGGQYYISQTCDQKRFEARKVFFVGVSHIFATGCSKCVFVIRSSVESISDKNYQMEGIGCDT